MKIKNYLTSFVIVFAITLVVSVVVTYLYTLLIHGAGAVDWDTSFRLAITFGIIFSWLIGRGEGPKAQKGE
jgi:hypothetical protein